LAKVVLALRKYKVVVTMKPIVFADRYVKEPTKEQILEQIALDLMPDDQFIISIEPAEEA